ncbi:MAG TPA: DUF1330 domain-containing protein [Dehalococcoidia bacterium]|nr:DUF1330 domain-containing protein [Dehalococcoidia bacterium]
MSVYCVAEVDVTDVEGFAPYSTAVPATIAQYGGRYLARGGRVESHEGGWQPKRLVIVEFPSMEQALAWYNSAEYRDLKAIRQRCAETKFVIVEGVS